LNAIGQDFAGCFMLARSVLSTLFSLAEFIEVE